MTSTQRLAQQYQGTDLENFLTSITPFEGGSMSGYKLEDAIAETANRFSAEKSVFGLYSFNGSEVIFMDRMKMKKEDERLIKNIRFLETESPSIYILAMGVTEKLPKAVFKPMSTAKDALQEAGVI